jgi:hypothetical protein
MTYSFEVKCTSQKLGIKRLNKVSEDKLKLMLMLSEEYGWDNRKITDFLNSNNIRTPKDLEYYPKLVWGTLKKYKKRLNRLNLDSVESVRQFLTVYTLIK